ncbi:MAG: hypothetical protein GWN58_05695, partial [Anaerolineae bacterium]|nr:hypothetical protein [Anaerolineae bacterium]
DFKTDAAIGSGSVIGTFLRIEDDLGLNDDASTVRGEGFVRLRPNHALEFGFMRLGRSGTSILDEEVEWQDRVFLVNATVDSSMVMKWGRLGY